MPTRAVLGQSGDRVQDAAFVMLGLLPLGMALASRSAPTFLVLAALVSLTGRLAEGHGRTLVMKLALLLSRPLVGVSVAFLAFAVLSLAWGHRPGVMLTILAEFLVTAAAGLSLALTLPRQMSKRLLLIAAACFGLACAVITIDLATGLAFRQAIGAKAFGFIHNRPAVTLVMVAWPIALLLWQQGYRGLTGGLAGVLVIVLALAESETAILGFLAGALGLGLALASPRLALACVGGTMLMVLAISPFLGVISDRALTPAVLSALSSAHARERIEIWNGFGAVVRERPILGAGFGTGPVLSTHPVAQEVPAELRPALSGWHAHNGYLQIWTELGLIGAALAAAMMALVLGAIARLPEPTFVAAMAVLGAGAAMILVGHGVWQGWWVGASVTSALWLTRRVR